MSTYFALLFSIQYVFTIFLILPSLPLNYGRMLLSCVLSLLTLIILRLTEQFLVAISGHSFSYSKCHIRKMFIRLIRKLACVTYNFNVNLLPIFLFQNLFSSTCASYIFYVFFRISSTPLFLFSIFSYQILITNVGLKECNQMPLQSCHFSLTLIPGLLLPSLRGFLSVTIPVDKQCHFLSMTIF